MKQGPVICLVPASSPSSLLHPLIPDNAPCASVSAPPAGTTPSGAARFYPKDNQPAALMLALHLAGPTPSRSTTPSTGCPPPRWWRRGPPPAPPCFSFVLKAPQRITHQKKLAGASADVRYLFEAAATLGAKQGPILFQLPPYLKKDAARLHEFVAELPEQGTGRPPCTARSPRRSPGCTSVVASCRASPSRRRPAARQSPGTDWPSPLETACSSSAVYPTVHASTSACVRAPSAISRRVARAIGSAAARPRRPPSSGTVALHLVRLEPDVLPRAEVRRLDKVRPPSSPDRARPPSARPRGPQDVVRHPRARRDRRSRPPTSRSGCPSAGAPTAGCWSRGRCCRTRTAPAPAKTAAKFRDSWKIPSSVTPSPKKVAASAAGRPS